MRHLISLFDLDPVELHAILSLGEQMRQLWHGGNRPPLLPRQVLAMLFEKPSLRTRVSFEAGILQLGGAAMFLGQEVGWQTRESTADFVRVLAQYADFIVCRAFSHSSVMDLASFDCVPVINGLTDRAHPCQALADLLTIQQSAGTFVGKQVTFVGDGNNVARSLAAGCAMVGLRFRLYGPETYLMPQPVIQEITERFPDADIAQSSDAEKMLKGADFVYTDVWTSMGQESESAKRRTIFSEFQVNSRLLRLAAEDCKVLHCLPAKRGEEVTDEILDSSASRVVQQAGNRMHAQKGLLVWLALQHGRLDPKLLKQSGIEFTR